MVDVHQAAATYRARVEAEQARLARRADALRAAVEVVAAELRARFGVGRVVLFGSLARGDHGAGSDVDLAVSGLSNEDYWSALATASRVLGTDAIDLVRLEEAMPALLETLDYEGVAL